MRNLMLGVVLAAALVCVPVGTVMAQCTPGAQNGDPWCDDFEGYNLGTFPPPPHPGNNNDWQTWGCAAGAEGDLRSTPTHSGVRALELNPADDVVREFVGYDLAANDFYVMTAWVYVPSSAAGDHYFIALNRYCATPQPTPMCCGGVHWSVQLRMNPGEGIIESQAGGQTLTLITNEWVEIRCEINLTVGSDGLNVIKYGGVVLAVVPWLGNVSTPPGNGHLAIECIDLFSDSGTQFYYDDVSLIGSVVPVILAPEVVCRTVERRGDGCAEFSWTVRNLNLTAPISTFYLDVETGDGAQICTDLSDIIPPAGWTAENCTGWVGGHALLKFSGGTPFFPGQQVSGRLIVDPNGPILTQTPTQLNILPYSIKLHGAQEQQAAVCALGNFTFGPSEEGDWSIPLDCTAFLPVPSMSTWAKALLALLLVGGGVFLVLRSRRPVTT